MRAERALPAAVALLGATACGPVLDTTGINAAPSYNPGQAKCQVAASQENPLVTEWEASEKAALEARLRAGPVVVAYSGCDLRVLSGCTPPGAYTWQRTTLSTDMLDVRDSDELYAKLPLGAVSLEGELQRSGRLAVRTTVAGQLRLTAFDARTLPVGGGCTGATHVVGALSIGAFELRKGGVVAASGGVDTQLGGTTGGGEREETVLRTSGNPTACSGTTDAGPHAECSSPVQIFLDALPATLARRAPQGRLAVRVLPADAAGPWDLKLGESVVCRTPCETHIDPEVPYRVVHDPGKGVYQQRIIDIPELSAWEGRDRVVIKPQARRTAEFVLGIVSTSIGGLVSAGGVAAIAAGCGSSSGWCTAGWIMTPLGLVAAGGGVYLIIDSRPRVFIGPDARF